MLSHLLKKGRRLLYRRRNSWKNLYVSILSTLIWARRKSLPEVTRRNTCWEGKVEEGVLMGVLELHPMLGLLEGEPGPLTFWLWLDELCAMLLLDGFAIDGCACEGVPAEAWPGVECASRPILRRHALAIRVALFAKSAGTSAHLFSPHTWHLSDLNLLHQNPGSSAYTSPVQPCFARTKRSLWVPERPPVPLFSRPIFKFAFEIVRKADCMPIRPVDRTWVSIQQLRHDMR